MRTEAKRVAEYLDEHLPNIESIVPHEDEIILYMLGHKYIVRIKGGIEEWIS